MCYIKEGIYCDSTPFELTRGSVDEVAYLAAQITFKFLTDEKWQSVEDQHKRLTEDQLEHLKRCKKKRAKVSPKGNPI